MAKPDFRAANQTCDLVMKGGITSGIVYPPAIYELAQTYRFRSIGGTSAGAIAAAATAAAELGRDNDGFEKLHELSDWLGKDGNLRNLFQPTPETRPLMDVLFALTQQLQVRRHSGLLGLLSMLAPHLLRHDRGVGAAAGACGGAALGWAVTRLSGGTLSGTGLLPSVVFAAAGGAAGGIGRGLADLGGILAKNVPENFFGLCSGHHEDSDSAEPPSLTDWLSRNLNIVAGLDPEGPPLTFADFEKSGIKLRMITSNLSHRRPYRLPFEKNTFLFAEADMRRLFPSNVVRYLCENAYQSDRVSLEQVPGFYFLPEGDLLPVVVATRMSLSFPLLLSAIPLYTITLSGFRKTRIEYGDLQRNIFSDGGISSNFPIHLFDAWLPSRPTFGINLTKLKPEALTEHDGTVEVKPEYASAMPDDGMAAPEATKDIFLPKANQPLAPDWEPIKNLFTFAGAIFGTAQTFRDVTQADLPSYRDRIVQIRLADHEGGLNLAMDPQTIDCVVDKGRRAGQEVLREFVFDEHRWVRLQVLMAQFEKQLHQLIKDYEAVKYPALVQANRPAGYPYRRTRQWSREALRRMEQLRSLVRDWEQMDKEWQASHSSWNNESFFVHNTPSPEPMLRVTPDL